MELLVVIAIIGMLVAMLLPAVQAAREAARNAQCRNNLKQIGSAMQMHENTKGILPTSCGLDQWSGYPAAGGWGTQLLPYIEETALAGAYNWKSNWFDDANQPVIQTPLAIYLCPSTPRESLIKTGLQTDAWASVGFPCSKPNSKAALGDYFGLAAAYYNPIGPQGDVYGVGALTQYNADNWVVLPPPKLSHITDGTSNTIAFVELAGYPFHWIKGQVQADLPSPRWKDQVGFWAGSQYFWMGTFTGDGVTQSPTIGPCTINCNNTWNGGTPYGFHSGGANAVFIDGAVQFLHEDMDGYLLGALVSRALGEIINNDD